MKHLAKFGVGLLALGMAACSSDEPVNPGATGEGYGVNDVYASLTIKLPTPSRAYDDFEVGKDRENNVGKVLVVLATQDADGTYKFLTKATSDAKQNNTDVPANTVKYVLNFSSKEMNPDPLDKENPGNTIPTNDGVYVFVYCNPSTALLERFENEVSYGKEFTDIVATINDKDNAEMWQDNRFLMTNWKTVKAPTIPSRDELINEHGTPEAAFSLGTVEVKRAAARFDFMSTVTDAGVNTYEIKDIDGETVIGKVTLTDMAMFNIAKNFYYLPRTNDNWLWNGKTTLCSGLDDDPDNFMMSYNLNGFKQAATLPNTVSDYYFSNIVNNSLSANSTSLKWVKLTDIDGNEEDNPEWKNDDNRNYHIWRYTTENTIPGSERTATTTRSQKVGITTGVVFRGHFDPVNTQRWNGNAVYVHDNVVYGDYDALVKYVKENPTTLVAADFAKVDVLSEAPANLKVSVLKGLDADERHGFKAYEPDTDGHYSMYYFYYNRHNSNGNPSVMGVNEFGVVRNNVYKLRVTAVGSLGEPTAPNKPDDPDENENAYFTVSCIVLPWTVRVNDIEF